MATKKISELDPAVALDGTELVEIVQDGANVQTTTQDIADLGGGGGGGSGPSVVETISGTTADLLAADAGKYVRFTNVAAKTLTVQPDATEAQTSNSEWTIRNAGTADLTISEGAGVTVNPPNGGTLVIPEGGTVSLKRVAVDEFDLMGQVVAL